MGPQWQSTKIDVKDYETVHDARLIWHDGLEVVKDLFSNPVFANYMAYDPHKVMRSEEWEYSEFFTGTRAFAIQVSAGDSYSAHILTYFPLHHRINFLRDPRSSPSFLPQIKRLSHVILVG